MSGGFYICPRCDSAYYYDVDEMVKRPSIKFPNWSMWGMKCKKCGCWFFYDIDAKIYIAKEVKK